MMRKVFLKEWVHYFRASRLIYILSTILTFLLPLYISGCSSKTFLPSTKETVSSPWNSYKNIQDLFDKINPYKTNLEDLDKLYLSPKVTPNIQILTHLDIMQRFIPNQSVGFKDLDDGLKDCLAAQDSCQAFEISIKNIYSERYGNVFLDLFNFRRKTKISGWEFKAIVVLKNDLVVYKISGGKPGIDEHQDRKNPLGPLQSSEKIIWATVR